MELRHLRYFVAVGEEQHYGRAAERLHVAQPALSRQIQDLEKEVGFVLFDRLPRGVRLNAAGKLFLADARRILQDVDEAKLRAERIAHGKAGTLRIGIATAVSWHGLVVDSFRELRAWQPAVELEPQHLLSVDQVEAILVRPTGCWICRQSHTMAQGLGTLGIRAGENGPRQTKLFADPAIELFFASLKRDLWALQGRRTSHQEV